MEKPKREIVTREMRARLLENRHGKLTSGQWRELVFEPMVTLLLLLVPGIIILRSTLLAFIVGGFWLVGLLGLVTVTLMLFFRARRYARLPLYYQEMTAAGAARPFWQFWGGDRFVTANDEVVRFSKRLAPAMPMEAGAPYLLYYLKEGKTLILLSIAPIDHPDANAWKPSSSFAERFKRRAD